MGIPRIRKQREQIHHRTPQLADIGCLRSPSENAAPGDVSAAEALPLASQLAWDLWESATSSLSTRERDVVAINLATREFFNAIKFLLAAAVRADAPIPTELGRQLTRWARTYVGHPDHPAICRLVAQASSVRRPASYLDRPLGTPSAFRATPEPTNESRTHGNTRIY
jgi:hypothetical protein